MARRIALARAIVMEPELLLYDEPFAGLDPISMNKTADMLRGITKELGTAGLLITHDIESLSALWIMSICSIRERLLPRVRLSKSEP
ncbi:hypothetical protein OURE66S_04416 [Oligella ureolytica]